MLMHIFFKKMMHIGWQEVRFYYTVDMHVAHLYVVDGGGVPLPFRYSLWGVTNNRITREREVDDTEI